MIYPLVESPDKAIAACNRGAHHTQGWPNGPVKQLRAQFVVFVDEVLSGLDLDDCSATGSFMPIPEELLLVHSRGKDFEFF